MESSKSRTDYVIEITQYLLERVGDPYTAAAIFEIELDQLNEWSIFDAVESEDWELAWQTVAQVVPLNRTIH